MNESNNSILYFGNKLSDIPDYSIVISKWNINTNKIIDHFNDAYLALCE